MQFSARKIVRLQNYDYSIPNYYFITICAHNRNCIFGTATRLSEMGNVARKDLIDLDGHYEGVTVDKFVVMPNHIHMILVLEGESEKRPSISQIVALYKAGVSRKIRKLNTEMIVWQRSFYEHVIRNQEDYDNIWNYIENNPLKWEMDRFYGRPGNG